MLRIKKSRKSQTFNMRLPPEEQRRLLSLAEYYGLSAAALLCMLLKQESERIDLE